MTIIVTFRKLLLAFWLVSGASASISGEGSGSSLPSLSSTIKSSLPSLFSKDRVQDAVDKEIRKMIVDYSAKVNATKAERRVLEVAADDEEEELFKASPNQRSLRKLTEERKGEWDEVNEILNSLELTIPATSIKQEALGLTLTANVNGSCSGISVEDILLDWDKSVSEDKDVQLAYKFQVIGAKIKCYIQVDWDTGVLDVSDEIRIKFVSNDNSFGVAVQVEGAPPQNSTFLGCKAKVNVGDIASSGGFSSDIINDLNYLIVDLVRSEATYISGTVCGILFNFTDTIDEILASIVEVVDPLLTEYTPVDPLFVEKNLEFLYPGLPELVSYQDTEGLGNIVNTLLTNLEGLLSAEQINSLVTSTLLDGDPNGAFVFELGEAPTTAPTTEEEADLAHDRFLQDIEVSDDLFEPIDGCFPDISEVVPLRRRLTRSFGDFVEDQLTLPGTTRSKLEEEVHRRLQGDTVLLGNITLDDVINTTDILVINELTPTKITVWGLNGFVDAVPLSVIGDYTLLTQLSLPAIEVQAEVFADVDVNGINVQNLITATVEIEDLFLNTSYVVGLSQAEVDTWTLGTFLQTENIATCIVAALEVFSFSKLEFTLGFIGTPDIRGVVSPAVNDLVNTGTEAAFCAYQDLVIEGIPGFVQNNVSLIANAFMECYIATNNATCPEVTLGDILPFEPVEEPEGDVTFDFDFNKRRSRASPKSGSRVPGFLDFRDLLLPPDQAVELGASGREPYGDLLAMAYTMLVDATATADNATGDVAINEFLPEELEMNMTLVDFNLNVSDMDIIGLLLQSAYVIADNVRITNINTLKDPLTFLKPTTNAHVLGNIFNWGPTTGRSIGGVSTVEQALIGNNSGLALANVMDAGGSASEMDLVADFRVYISTMDFINFPIADILNFNCWMALVQTPDQPVNGQIVEHGFELQKFMLDIVEMSVHVDCLNCTSNLLPGVFDALDRLGAMNLLGNRLGPLIEQVATSDFVSPLITDTIGIGDAAGRLCPHSPLYNTTANETELEVNTSGLVFPQLDNEGIDTVMFASVIFGQVFAVVFSESHVDNDLPLNDPLAGQEYFDENYDLPADANLLDWYRLNETFIPFAGDALELVKDFVGPTEDGDLGINSIFGEDFNLTLGLSLDLIDGYEIVVDEVRLIGLESFRQFDILEPIAPQTLQNNISMDNLTIVIDMNINVTNSSEPAIPYRVTVDVKDVNATIYLFTAIDMDKVEALELGQLLFIENVIPCFIGASYNISVPAMRVTVGSISEPVVEGLLPDTDEMAERALKKIFDVYQWIMVEATNSIFDHTVRVVVNDFIQGFINDTAACLTTEEIYANGTTELIDFRDFLLPPEEALALGGAGTQPYGDAMSTAYALVLDQLASNGTGEPLELNSFVEDFTLDQSGEVGTFKLEDKLLELLIDFADFGLLINQTMEVIAYNARVRNLNTLVSPMVIGYPTTHPHIIDNVINFGPIPGKPLNGTTGAILDIDGELEGLNMYNEFDLSGELEEVDVYAALTLYILTENLMTFPLRDVLELDCWLSLVQHPNATKFDDDEIKGFKFENVLAKLAELSINSNCLNCTSRVLDDAIAIVDNAGASETFGDRLGFLIEDVATGDVIDTFLSDFGFDFGDKAGQSCPHHPLYNTSSTELEETNSTFALPALSYMSVDTLLFAGVIFAEIAVVVGADNHLQNPGDPTDPLYNQKLFEVPGNATLIDWQNMESVGIPFMEDALDITRDFLNVYEGGADEGINGFIAGFTDANGTTVLPLDGFSFEQAGVLLTITRVSAVDLLFSDFDALNPIAAQTMQNSFYLPKVEITIGFSVDILESTEPPNNLTVTVDMEGVNGSVPVFAAVDEDKLGALKLGQLLFIENVLPCLLSTTYGFQVEEMNIEIANISQPVFDGFMGDTGDMVEKSTDALHAVYGEMIRESIPLVFQDTLRVMINSFLLDQGNSSCKTYPQNTSYHYIDFRQMFQPTNATEYSPYGDIIPIAREILEKEFFSVNEETNLPKINDAVIAPFTEDQSGVTGTLLLPGKIFGFETEGFSSFGISNIELELFDARVENFDTVGEPLQVAEPNHTRPDLLDNAATFGTQFSPLRFAIRGKLTSLGPLGPTYDEMDVFGEMRAAPIFAVLLARIGSEEFLNFPLGSTSSTDCWLGTLAAPALKAILDGETEVQPIIGFDYLNIAFQNMRLSASCYNCTTGGLEVVPDLLEILETSTAKNVLGHRNVELLLNITNSDFAQVWMLRIFQDSIRKCEHTPNSTLSQILVPNTDFPELNDYHMETGVFTVTAMIQLGLVIMAETIEDVNGTEPLIAGPEVNIENGTRLVDFTELDQIPNGRLALSMFDFMNGYLGEPEIDEETGEESLGINGFLGNPIAPFSDYTFEDEIDIGISNLKVRTKKVVVSGLDTFTRFEFANITGPTTMRHAFGWEYLTITVDMEVDLTGEPEMIFRRSLYDEDDPFNDGIFEFQLEITLQDVLLETETFIALDYELMEFLELGNFLRFEYIMPCMQATILHLELLDSYFEVGKVTQMKVTGFQSPDVMLAAENLEESLVEEYGEVIASMAPTLFDAGGRNFLNGAINDYLRTSGFECDEFPFDNSTGGFVDFRDLFLAPADSMELGGTGKEQYGDVIHTFFGFSQLFIRFFLLPELDEGLSFPGALFDQGIRFDVRQFKSVMVLRVSDLEITNPNSIGTLTYTEPVDGEPFVLDNEIKMGIGRKRLVISFRVFLAFKGLGKQLSEVDIQDDFQVTITIRNLELILQTFMKVVEEKFVKFPLRDVLNLDCWLATIPPPELDEEGYKVDGTSSNFIINNLEILFREMNMEIECYNCTSPGLMEMNELLQQPGAAEDFSEEVEGWIGNITEALGGQLLQDIIDNLVTEAPTKCPHSEGYQDPNATSFKFNPAPQTASNDAVYLTYLLAIVIPLVVFGIIIYGVRTIVHRRHKKWLDGLPSERVFLIQQKQERDEHQEAEINEITQSMFESEEVPPVARYLVPFIVVVNIAFFLSGHLNLGGRAMLDITIAGEYFRVDNFYDFSIAQSTLDLWHAGGEELATLILLFSGIWPYTKQLITLALWFLPPSVVSVSRRGQFLLWLDVLAKWSMIDIFVLFITVAGFRLGGISPEFSFLPPEFWNMQLIVVPMWGLYANMIAQLMSQISSHFIVMYHRRILKTGKRIYKERHHPNKQQLAVAQQDVSELLSPDVPEDEKTEQLCKHPFIRPHKTEGAKLVARRVVNGFLPITSIGLSVLLVFCCYWPSLTLEAYGVFGIGIEMGNKFTEQAVRSESIFSMAKILIDQAKYLGELRHYLGNGFLSILFITTLLVVPILALGTLMFLWLVPTTRKRKNKLAILLEILAAWQYVEVYMLGIIIESWQLGSISKLFINRYCESINGSLELIAAYGIINPRDAQCFELGASIAEGAYALIPFTIGLALVGSYVIKAYIQTLREYHDEEEDVTEEEKLRAFDRTTWDSREGALENIRDPPVLFTDTYRWTLVGKAGTAGEAGSLELTVADEAENNADKPPQAVTAARTQNMADTSDSDEVFGNEDEAAAMIPPEVEKSLADEMAIKHSTDIDA